ncbi:putative selenocysteine-specific elongation factor [Encephalitozoon hellem]|uniref:Selenocysteine-specific elongation factor n=1 Tax=Encephalitozoon hellem TaxID=27973 RepID=A0ABY8CKX9_ENCHE|nr:putative selenocysteine-specific elongation factor [Encephalitozoon hellem]WEL39369.1 putative selenocysteine-specific elongation factor [Encephalitozoon hellem]WEL39553.1 putative selenocysteine-specific elongation factor [Encephalitozoon hellem]WEL39761.1 putative selenocysteine-specific elongation factor [Encephalitozoon hellem]WEL39775.1 putative selenocysteine-specific elongation factor [Encephalitozoon hellem]
MTVAMTSMIIEIATLDATADPSYFADGRYFSLHDLMRMRMAETMIEQNTKAWLIVSKTKQAIDARMDKKISRSRRMSAVLAVV